MVWLCITWSLAPCIYFTWRTMFNNESCTTINEHIHIYHKKYVAWKWQSIAYKQYRLPRARASKSVQHITKLLCLHNIVEKVLLRLMALTNKMTINTNIYTPASFPRFNGMFNNWLLIIRTLMNVGTILLLYYCYFVWLNLCAYVVIYVQKKSSRNISA